MGKAVPLSPCRHQEEEEVYLLLFLTSALYGVSGQRHAAAALYPRERTPFTYWRGDWVGLDVMWTQGLEEKPFASAGDRNPVVHSVLRQC
jgi:hypothetical protein